MLPRIKTTATMYLCRYDENNILITTKYPSNLALIFCFFYFVPLCPSKDIWSCQDCLLLLILWDFYTIHRDCKPCNFKCFCRGNAKFFISVLAPYFLVPHHYHHLCYLCHVMIFSVFFQVAMETEILALWLLLQQKTV